MNKARSSSFFSRLKSSISGKLKISNDKSRCTSVTSPNEDTIRLNSEVIKLQHSLDEEKSLHQQSKSKIKSLQSQVKKLECALCEARQKSVAISTVTKLEKEKSELRADRDRLFLEVCTLKPALDETRLALKEALSKTGAGKQGISKEPDSVQAQEDKKQNKKKKEDETDNQKSLMIASLKIALNEQKVELRNQMAAIQKADKKYLLACESFNTKIEDSNAKLSAALDQKLKAEKKLQELSQEMRLMESVQRDALCTSRTSDKKKQVALDAMQKQHAGLRKQNRQLEEDLQKLKMEKPKEKPNGWKSNNAATVNGEDQRPTKDLLEPEGMKQVKRDAFRQVEKFHRANQNMKREIKKLKTTIALLEAKRPKQRNVHRCQNTEGKNKDQEKKIHDLKAELWKLQSDLWEEKNSRVSKTVVDTQQAEIVRLRTEADHHRMQISTLKSKLRAITLREAAVKVHKN